MSAGSAFASGIRAGQNIWNQAVNNAMAGKRMDMLKTQFQYEQRQRKQTIENEIAAQDAFERFQSSIPTTDFDFKRQEDRDLYEKNMVEFYSDISRDPATLKQFQAYNKTMGIIGDADIANKIKANQANIGLTWDLYNNGKPRPQVLNQKTKELVDDYNLMDQENFDKTIERKRREAESKYGGGGMSQFFGSKASELSPGVRENYIIERKKYFDAALKTGDNETIVKESFVWGDSPTQSETDSLNKYKFTTDRLSELSEAIEGETTGPISGLWRNFKVGLGLDKKAALINAQITKIIPGLARGVFGEVGVLTDQDVKMYSKTIGNLNTPEEVNEALTKAAMDMVADGFENRLSTLAKSRKNVSGYLSQLKDVKAQSRALLGEEEEEEIPLIEANSYEVVNGQPNFSAEDYEKIKQLGVSQFRIIDKEGAEHTINIPQQNDSTTPPAPKPNPANSLLPKPAPSSDEIDKKLDRKLKIEKRINVLQDQLDKLPSPPNTNRRSSYVPITTNTKSDRDTEKRRKQLIESIKKNKENLSKL